MTSRDAQDVPAFGGGRILAWRETERAAPGLALGRVLALVCLAILAARRRVLRVEGDLVERHAVDRRLGSLGRVDSLALALDVGRGGWRRLDGWTSGERKADDELDRHEDAEDLVRRWSRIAGIRS